MEPIFLHNYHSHTSRCGHATGNDEQYVLCALDAGFKTIGFSDHAMLPGIHQPRIRGNYQMLEDYIKSVTRLRKKYSGKIDVKLAFEGEYLGEPFNSYYKELLEERGFDYLILGQHCFYNPTFKEMNWYGDLRTRLDALYRYRDDLINGMKSGLYVYVAHPDFFVYFLEQWNEAGEKVAHEICKAAVECHIPLELNMGHTRSRKREEWFVNDQMIYPYPEFWKIVSQYDIDVIVGVDAHAPYDYQDSNYEAFAEILRNYKLKWLQKLDI